MKSLRISQEPRVVIAIPLATSLIYWQVVAGILALEKPSETDLMVFQGALVDRARNHLVEQMFSHPIEPTHILFLDGDILPAHDTLTRLLAAGEPIVSGVYRKRLPPHEPMAFRFQGKKLKPISPTAKSKVSVDAVGGGCLLVERHVFEKIKAPWFTSEWTSQGHLSEDFSFCRKAQKAGFKIWADPKVNPLHIEPMGIGNDRDQVSFVSLT